MQNSLWLLFLGAVQGLTEFLPVSSSGHLVFLQQVLKLREQDLLFDTVLHLGSLLAILFYFRKELIDLFKRTAFFLAGKGDDRFPGEITLLIAVSLPLFIVGFFLLDFVEKSFQSPKILPFTFSFTAIILFWGNKAEEKKNKIEDISFKDALVVGFFQALAVLPGVSRSGTTYSSARQRKIGRKTAFYFSFLMAIPAIFASFILQFFKLGAKNLSMDFLGPFFVSFVSSLAALALFSRIINSKKIYIFAFYCIFMAGLSLFMFY